jgi:hypothetical protein
MLSLDSACTGSAQACPNFWLLQLGLPSAAVLGLASPSRKGMGPLDASVAVAGSCELGVAGPVQVGQPLDRLDVDGRRVGERGEERLGV